MDPMVCKGSCDIYLDITLQPRLKARAPTLSPEDEHGPRLTQFTGKKSWEVTGGLNLTAMIFSDDIKFANQ